VRWELKLNGKRPTAVLRPVPALWPAAAPQPPAETKRMIYFVGELLGDEKSGGMTMEQLVKTVSEVYEMSYGQARHVIEFHKDAQLLVVTGTIDEIQFIQQTLSALKEKVQLERKSQPKAAEPKVKAEEPKTH
jgi:ribosome biogenesis SPOUT family RNA methylase Rps3